MSMLLGAGPHQQFGEQSRTRSDSAEVSDWQGDTAVASYFSHSISPAQPATTGVGHLDPCLSIAPSELPYTFTYRDSMLILGLLHFSSTFPSLLRPCTLHPHTAIQSLALLEYYIITLKLFPFGIIMLLILTSCNLQ